MLPEFNVENYEMIRSACAQRKEVIFTAPIEITLFAAGKIPQDWTPYSPSMALPPEEYAIVFAYAGDDAKGALMKLEFLVNLAGGQVLYKEIDDKNVGVKVEWPDLTHGEQKTGDNCGN